MGTTGELEETLAGYRELIRQGLEEAVPEIRGSLGRLSEAMRYSLNAGGKRMRPALCLAACQAVCGQAERAKAPAVALELIHTYSLIHDDLPCMDDDDVRRGKPTNHKVFGEGMAVLAGDGLLTRAFEVLASDETLPAEPRLEMVRVLAGAAGAGGMVGGQALDLAAEGSDDVDLPTLQFIHTHKTGALFSAACRLGALAGRGSPQVAQQLGKFGEKVGLAFQIVDDLLDVTAAPRELGKAAQKDEPRGKATYPGVLGLSESRLKVEELGRAAERIAAEFSERGRALVLLARFATERSS
jgi:geranylgeranyl diphosphate synthase type II